MGDESESPTNKMEASLDNRRTAIAREGVWVRGGRGKGVCGVTGLRVVERRRRRRVRERREPTRPRRAARRALRLLFARVLLVDECHVGRLPARDGAATAEERAEQVDRDVHERHDRRDGVEENYDEPDRDARDRADAERWHERDEQARRDDAREGQVACEDVRAARRVRLQHAERDEEECLSREEEDNLDHRVRLGEGDEDGPEEEEGDENERGVPARGAVRGVERAVGDQLRRVCVQRVRAFAPCGADSKE
jgi:hypothetical protein